MPWRSTWTSRPRTLRQARRARASSELAAAVQALELREALARGRWADGLLSLAVLEVRTADAQLRASGELRPGARAGSGRADLQAPGLQVNAQGKLAERSGGGTMAASGANLAQALPWLARLPGVPAELREMHGCGPRRGEAGVAGRVARSRRASQPGRAAAGAANRRGRALDRAGCRRHDQRPPQQCQRGSARPGGAGPAAPAVDLAGQGGRRSQTPQVWQGQVATLKLSASDPAMGTGTWTLSLQRAFDIRWSDGSFDAAAGEALLTAPARPRPRGRKRCPGRAGLGAGAMALRRAAHGGTADRTAAGLARNRRRPAAGRPGLVRRHGFRRAVGCQPGRDAALARFAGAQPWRAHGAGRSGGWRVDAGGGGSARGTAVAGGRRRGDHRLAALGQRARRHGRWPAGDAARARRGLGLALAGRARRCRASCAPSSRA